ncbi:flagellin [Brevibacillus agri]|uniref:flagellin N-terminal helical domain-containing protein n=1 Tax=Brevibacillus agri TaxID=51101 RepID=UPI0025B6F427|nr:flagellin [Brevibacillus agri]MDN4091771.1 flagellin [Brevibacillus agri]
MRINHNIASLNTYRQLTTNTLGVNKALEKLSSGLRINRAGDDAAGLAISEKMRGQIRGLEMAAKNAQDGISLIQTAEGALNETHSILQRMRELAVQASNDTNTTTDRSELQKEIEQLKSEINRISNDTEFNSKKLLDGSFQLNATITTAGNTKVATVTAVDSNLQNGNYTIETSSVTLGNNVTANGTGLAAITNKAGQVVNIGDYKVEFANYDTTSKTVDITIKDASGATVATGAAVNISSWNTTAVNVGNFSLTGAAAGVAADGTANAEINMDATFTVKNSSGQIVETKSVTDNDTGKVTVGGFEIGFKSDLAVSTTATAVSVSGEALSFHIGANANQTTNLALNQMNSTKLGISNVDVTTKSGAESAITAINTAIETISSERAKLGAIQNRLEHTINNLGTASENLTAAESRIRDVDMAKEMMEFTKNNILTQAAQAMLAQANQQPQGVLQLLR